MKNLFTILETERDRILDMHINATKRNYLTEQSFKSETWSSGILPANFDANKFDVSSLDENQKRVIDNKLRELVSWIKTPKFQDKQITITIEAATSESGRFEYNEKLTKQRWDSGYNYVNNYLKTNLPQEIIPNIKYDEPVLKVEAGVGKDYQYFIINANASALTKSKDVQKGRKLFWVIDQDVVVNVKRIKYCAKRNPNWVVDGSCAEVKDAFYQNSAGRWVPACDNQVLKSLEKTIGNVMCFQYEGTNWFQSKPECADKFKNMTNFKPEFENLVATTVDDMSGIDKLNGVLSSWCKSRSF